MFIYVCTYAYNYMCTAIATYINIHTYIYSVQLLANKVAMYSKILCTLYICIPIYCDVVVVINYLTQGLHSGNIDMHVWINSCHLVQASLAMYIIMYVCIVARRRGGGETADPQSSFIWRGEYHHRPC